ncbi:DnaJ domain-containing protein [Pseudomonas sp. Larv2_ips]|uniref:J domain-containing protein n=1 Tax=Pseudomonas sp. Larv2_ips TaxID=1896942 RepID=UPI0021140D7C|nr:J domain-containing protein [Pseudomonas sp. Larv2_ips]
MTCWDVLGLSPNADSRTIKRQYATLLKKTRPDDDPEGFQRLREAYEHALNWQQWTQEDDGAELAVATVPTALAAQTLQEHYTLAMAAGAGLEFEVGLLKRCLWDEELNEEDRRWAFDTFQWLSAWQRLELPQALIEALAEQRRQAFPHTEPGHGRA